MFHGDTEMTYDSVVLFLLFCEWVVFGGFSTDLAVGVYSVCSQESTVHPGGNIGRQIVQKLLALGNTPVMSSAGFAFAQDEDLLF